MADFAHQRTDEMLEAMEKRLSAIYSKALKGVQKKSDEYFAQFARLDKKNRATMQPAEYQRWRMNKFLYGQRYKKMLDEISYNLLNVNKIAMAYINGELPEVYTLNYNAFYDTTRGNLAGYNFTMTDESTVAYLAKEYPNLLPYQYIDGKKDIRWNQTKINGEILQGILQGESIPKIAGRMENVLNMNHVAAVRNARTAVTSAENKGRMDSYERAEDEGITVYKEWMATLDGRTRHSHRLLDGQTAKIGKPFKSEFGDIMYPGDPTAHPANVYNCRCTLVADVEQEESQTRIARDKNGKSVIVQNMSYEEWQRWRAGK